MTTSNLKHHPETLILPSQSFFESNKQRVTRRTLQNAPVATFQRVIENNNQSFSPSKIDKSKTLSQTGSAIQQQQTSIGNSKNKSGKFLAKKKRHSISMISLQTFSKVQKEPNTPERQGFKIDLEQTSRKNEHSEQLECYDDHTSSPTLIVQTQNVKKRSQIDFASPYAQHRKSYRKQFLKRDKDFISIRRNPDPLENKIINVINKLNSGKKCSKEIMHLSQKMGKMNSKQLANKFIISGYYLISKIVLEKISNKKQDKQEEQDFFEKELIAKIIETKQKIEENLNNELSDCQQFQVKTKELDIDKNQLKRFLVLKTFEILKQKKQKSRQTYIKSELQDESIKMTESFMKKEVPHQKNVMKYIQRVKSEEKLEF